MLIGKVRQTIGAHHLFNRGDIVLVAVSGGVDSVVLLDVLRTLATEYGLMIAVAHLDHGLRPESAEDAAWVERMAREAGVPFHAERLTPGTLPSQHGAGLEEAAREARHGFLSRTAARIGARSIALGHTATDRAETILFHLTRGAGPAGLAAMQADAHPIVRPLIAATRADVLHYARDRGLLWREDSTNRDICFARNRIRHKVLPELERINPQAVRALCRAGDLARDAQENEAFLVAQLWDSLAVPTEMLTTLRRDALAALPRSVRALVLREGCRRARGDLLGIDREHIRDLDAFVDQAGRPGGLDLPGLHVSVDARNVVFGSVPAPSPTPVCLPVSVGRTPIPSHGTILDLRVTAHTAGDSATWHGDPLVELADADRVSFPLILRTRRPGDRFVPLGMDAPVKLKDFLIGEKVPREDRDRVLLLCDANRILWVVGIRLSDAVRIDERTKTALVMRMETSP